MVSVNGGWSWPGKSKKPSRLWLPMSKKKWLDQREAQELLVEADRLLVVGADQGLVVDPGGGGRRPLGDRPEVAFP